MKFEVRGLADDLHGAARIGNAGKLDLNTVPGLLADVRLGHAELVDAAPDGAQRLILGHILDLLDMLRREVGRIPQLTVFGGNRLGHVKRAEAAGQDFLKSLTLLLFGQHKFQRVSAHHAGTQHDDALFTGGGAQILAGQSQSIGHGFPDIHPQRQMDAAFEVQPQVHPGVGQDAPQRRSLHTGQTRQHIGHTYHKNKQRQGDAPAQTTHATPSKSCLIRRTRAIRRGPFTKTPPDSAGYPEYAAAYV